MGINCKRKMIIKLIVFYNMNNKRDDYIKKENNKRNIIKYKIFMRLK